MEYRSVFPRGIVRRTSNDTEGVLKDTPEGTPRSNSCWLSRKGVTAAIPIVRAEGVDRMKGGVDRSGRTARRYAEWGYRQLSFLVEADRIPSQTHKWFCYIRALIVARFLRRLRLSFSPARRLSFSLAAFPPAPS